MKLRHYIIGATGILFFNSFVKADESLWVYATGTDTRPKRTVEFKLSDTVRIGKRSGSYTFHDIRPEIEYGLTDKLTLGVEAMIFRHDYSVNDPNLNPMYDTQQASGGSFKKTQFAGYELSLKYNVLSPYKDIIGLSIKTGYEFRDKYRLDGSDINQDTFYGQVLLQKNWIDDKLTLAINIKTEFERRKSPGVLEEEIAFDLNLGISYRVAPKHFLGLEYRRQQDHLSPFNTETNNYDDPSLTPSNFDATHLQLGSRHQYGNYIGPTYHFAMKKWWITTGALFQVSGGGSQHAYNKGGKNFDEHEEIHVNVTLAYQL
jgi:hypothetical protein